MYGMAKGLQGESIINHKNNGGKIASNWGVVAAGIAGSIAAVIFIMLIAFL